MKRVCAFLIICALILGCKPADLLCEEILPQAAVALTLADCYRMSLIQSEIIAIKADLIKETEAHFLQALSIMAPHFSFMSTDLQEAPPDEPNATFSSLKPNKSSTRYFNYSQTLFSGFKAIAAMRGVGYEKSQRINEKTRAEQLLLVDVSDSFYLLMEKREDRKTLERIRIALVDRVKELRAREKLGRSRPSEVVNAKTQLYVVESSIELVNSQEIIARQILEFLIGQSVSEIADTYALPRNLMPQDHYAKKADLRPDVEAAKFAWQLSRENILVVDSGFLPQVDVDANYYVQRTAFDKGTDWDVTLSFDVPIFDGGRTLGDSRQANLQADQKRLELHRKKRETPYDIKNTYVALTAAMAVHDALKKAYTTAKLNYYLQKKDYSRSLVNNLDVLASIQTLQNAERDYIKALYEAKRQYWKLRVAVGQSGTEALNDAF